ncbi:glycosyltransferase [bacterium]|nr:glycosyltransferase [bacterium]
MYYPKYKIAKRPFFSVLIPSFNRPVYVVKTVRSVLKSSFSNFEIIISDDNSPKRSEIRKNLKQFESDRRVNIYWQQSNLGEAKNRGFLLNQANGEWHIILGDDDLMYESGLKKIATIINSLKEPELVVFGYSIIDEEDNKIFTRRSPRLISVDLNHRYLLQRFLQMNDFPFWYFHPATFCSSRNLVTKIESNKNVGIGDDIMFLIDYINLGKSIYIAPEVIFSYRKFKINGSEEQKNQSMDDVSESASRYLILKELQSRSDIHPNIKKIISTENFEYDFFYSGCLIKGLNPNALKRYLNVAIRNSHYKRLQYVLKNKHKFISRIYGYFSRSISFCRIVGFPGLIEIVRVIFQRLRKTKNN